MESSIKVKTDLDEKVKNIQGLLQQLTHQERMDYIKDMIPSLISTQHEITENSQRLVEKHLTPFTNLSKDQHNLLNELTDKTEYLYKMMNGTDY